MKLANGVGTVYKLSGNRRNPYIVRKTVGWDIDTETGKRKQQYITIGYAPTRAKRGPTEKKSVKTQSTMVKYK